MGPSVVLTLWLNNLPTEEHGKGIEYHCLSSPEEGSYFLHQPLVRHFQFPQATEHSSRELLLPYGVRGALVVSRASDGSVVPE